MSDKGYNKNPEEVYEYFMEETYKAADDYIGQFLHLLDEDWTVFIVSDHAQVCPKHDIVGLGEMTGMNITVMEELGLTVLKRDENGNKLPEIDWDRTVACAPRSNHIYLNLKGRDPHGIVEPKDKYEWEEEIMTRLYGYKNPATGKRVVALALRNKDAVLLGMGGPQCGDIVYWVAEGYNADHTDSLSTTWGEKDTSVSPIFIAAGKGLKQSFTTDRIIRQVDLVPTMCVMGNVRMPAQCEGAPVYQILEEGIEV
ncbi:MAG: alkaline phosphatase family protein, partial [Peptococcaceae bacterium]|nr:alkaline phosphatase family protein [Peptococcaceae bacterium]